MCSIIFGQRWSRERSALLVKRETLGKLVPYCLINLIEQHILGTWYVPGLISEERTAGKEGDKGSCQVLLIHVQATGDLTEQFWCGDGVKLK